MSVDRPTFHEAWYRVAGLRPRLLAGVRVYRQDFRGQIWHVLENPSNNNYIRISDDAYHFVGLLDGKRTITEIWQICNDQHGDRSPTQGEVIQILAQLFSSNLLFADSNMNELIRQGNEVLSSDNLIILYVCIVVIKVLHEFGHAFACKRFGRLNNGGGQVHVMGVMFMVFLPLPYVDASSAWAFRNKWHRAIVGMSGILVELALASVAVIVWANTSAGLTHAFAYNLIFIASISTILFNGNPLLRFDAYYVLADVIEIPNLSKRSIDYFYYLVRTYAWKVRNAVNPANSRHEKYWLIFYGIASTAYRIFISIQILLFLNDRLPEDLFIIVPLFAIPALIMWLLFPIGKFIRYLATNA